MTMRLDPLTILLAMAIAACFYAAIGATRYISKAETDECVGCDMPPVRERGEDIIP
jgi:hypothetical protein